MPCRNDLNGFLFAVAAPTDPAAMTGGRLPRLLFQNGNAVLIFRSQELGTAGPVVVQRLLKSANAKELKQWITSFEAMVGAPPAFKRRWSPATKRVHVQKLWDTYGSQEAPAPALPAQGEAAVLVPAQPQMIANEGPCPPFPIIQGSAQWQPMYLSSALTMVLCRVHPWSCRQCSRRACAKQ